MSETSSAGRELSLTDTEASQEDWPRFLVAVHRLEEFFADTVHAAEGTPEQRADYAFGLMRACSPLTQAAQAYDFACSVPELAETGAVVKSSQTLLDVIESPGIPEGVRTIYQETYAHLYDQAALPTNVIQSNSPGQSP